MEHAVGIERLEDVQQKPEGLETYLLLFQKVPASMEVEGEVASDIPLYGDMLIDVDIREGKPRIFRTRGVSLWTETFDPIKSTINFSGPIQPGYFTQDQPGEPPQIKDLQMYLYYSALGEDPIPPAYQNDDATYPELELMEGWLSGELILDKEDQVMAVRLGLEVKLLKTVLGKVAWIRIDPYEIPALPLVDGNNDDHPHHSLTTPPQSPPSGPGINQPVREVSLRFINFSVVYNNAPGAPSQAADEQFLEDLANEQMDGVGEVWMAKAGIRVVPDALTVLPNPDTSFLGSLTEAQENNLYTLSAATAALRSTSAVEVFLVDELKGNPNNGVYRRGGGSTVKGGSNDATIFLQINKAMETGPAGNRISLNRFLLAHELSHVLGVDHPVSAGGGGSANQTSGSENSVVVPDRPCSPRNTFNNMNRAQLPLGGVFRPATSPGGGAWNCQWQPDNEETFFHVVRDFPYDDGTPNIAPRGTAAARWTHSDVWNARANAAGYPNDDELDTAGAALILSDYSPNNADPSYSKPNYMLVRLHTGQELASAPVAHLFLANPGASSTSLQPLTGAGGLPFSLAGNGKLKPGFPQTLGIGPWTIPAGWGPSFCVFAVVVSANDYDTNEVPAINLNTIIGNPGGYSFYNLFHLIGSDNDVAQRNLHVQSSSGNGMSMLPFIFMSNPFKEPGEAELEIRIPEGSFVREVQLEIDNQPGAVIEPNGKVNRIRLWKVLSPKIDHTLRLTARMQGGKAGDQAVPIETRMLVNGTLVSGFTYEIRPSAAEQVAFQVMDQLYGTLLNLRSAFGPAFKKAGLRSLPERFLEQVQIAEQYPDRALAMLREHCADFWKLSLMMPKSSRSGMIVRRWVGNLAEILDNPGLDTELSDQFEPIRDVTNRIHEAAGRGARRRLKID